MTKEAFRSGSVVCHLPSQFCARTKNPQVTVSPVYSSHCTARPKGMALLIYVRHSSLLDNYRSIQKFKNTRVLKEIATIPSLSETRAGRLKSKASKEGLERKEARQAESPKSEQESSKHEAGALVRPAKVSFMSQV